MDDEVKHVGNHAITVFSQIPTEILGDILSYISNNSQLAQIALVSRRFRDLVQPLLYRSINLQLRCPVSSRHERDDAQKTGNLHLFFGLVDTFTKNPHLRSCVTKLHLSASHHPYDVAFSGHAQLISILPALRDVSLTPPPIDLDLSTCTQLESLSLNFSEYSGQYGNEPEDSEEKVNPFEVIARHMWIPTLRRLHLDTIWPDPDPASQHLSPLMYGTSPITELSLRHGHSVNARIFPDLLYSIKALKSFVFESDNPWYDEDIEAHRVSPAFLGQALHPHSQTLVELIVAGHDVIGFRGQSLMDNLKSFPSLKRLGIPEVFLVSPEGRTIHDCLPPHLEELQLEYILAAHQWTADEQLRCFGRMDDLADSKHVCFPRLTLVRFWIQDIAYLKKQNPSFHRLVELHLGRLPGRFEEVGVDFDWFSSLYLPETMIGPWTLLSGSPSVGRG
ncbi:hypothetical protein MMC19_005640 [Ptychographa xylographoides]|nr:hypothetical protein [Ptychographa xylographoides]